MVLEPADRGVEIGLLNETVGLGVGYVSCASFGTCSIWTAGLRMKGLKGLPRDALDFFERAGEGVLCLVELAWRPDRDLLDFDRSNGAGFLAVVT